MEEDRVVHMLASLPESYDILVTALEASVEVLKWKLSPGPDNHMAEAAYATGPALLVILGGPALFPKKFYMM